MSGSGYVFSRGFVRGRATDLRPSWKSSEPPDASSKPDRQRDPGKHQPHVWEYFRSQTKSKVNAFMLFIMLCLGPGRIGPLFRTGHDRIPREFHDNCSVLRRSYRRDEIDGVGNGHLANSAGSGIE